MLEFEDKGLRASPRTTRVGSKAGLRLSDAADICVCVCVSVACFCVLRWR